MVDGSRRPPRHRCVSRSRVGSCLPTRCRPVAEQIGRSLAYTREDVVQPGDTPRFEEWVRRRFGPELTTLGLPGNQSDPDDRQSRRATLLSLVGVTGNAADVQKQAGELALK